MPSLEVVAEVVLVQCNLVDNQYQEKSSEILDTFTPNKFVCLFIQRWTKQFNLFKKYNTEFDGINITFTDQNGRPLELKHKITLILFINQ